MNKLFNLILLVAGICFYGDLQAQRINVTGSVTGDDTHEALPFAHIIIDSLGTTSNIYGKFGIHAHVGDTILFSYIGYKKRRIVIPDTLKTDHLELDVVLLKDITFLKNVTISSLPETLDDLKEVILETKLEDSEDLENAQKGINLATYQYLYMRSFKLNMTAYDNYAMFLKGNEGLNPAGGNIKGLLKFLKNRAKGIPLEGTYQHYKYYEKTKNE